MTPKHIPLRTCLGCLQKRPKFSMLRMAYRNGELLGPDPEQRRHGRGFYLCPAAGCIREFFRRKRYRKVGIALSEDRRQKLERELLAMIRQDKVQSLVGLARKAGKVMAGQTAVDKAVRSRQARLVILAQDAALNTRKHFIDLCRAKNIPLRLYGKKEDWGRWMGKDETAILAVLHDGFARALQAEIARAESEKE